MITHPKYSSIIMHSDNELESLLGAKIQSRKIIHDWPLSCVQELQIEDGTKLIYKSQLPPTVEPCFYECASSILLPHHRSLGSLGECEIMTIEWIDAPLLKNIIHSDIELVEQGWQLISQIGDISGDLPTYLDIGSVDAWSIAGEVMFEKLSKLVLDGQFKLMDFSIVERLRNWARSDNVNKIITNNPRVTHGDLKADQVFVTTDGYKVIDWQRPVVAPPELDLVALLIGQNVKPRQFVDTIMVDIFWFLRLNWAVETQFDLFPNNRWQIFDKWASEAIIQILEPQF